jgi:hypothetical protein
VIFTVAELNILKYSLLTVFPLKSTLKILPSPEGSKTHVPPPEITPTAISIVEPSLILIVAVGTDNVPP